MAVLNGEYLLPIVLALLLIESVLLIYWYRQGDLDPKFKGFIALLGLTLLFASSACVRRFEHEESPRPRLTFSCCDDSDRNVWLWNV